MAEDSPPQSADEYSAYPQKKARREGRLIVFVDESGISERPTRVRTWAPKGQTPIIQFHFNWNHVSVIAGVTRTNCLFRLHEASIKKEEIVDFLKALKAYLKQPLLVIWDGLKAHRSRLVREYLDSLNGHIQIAFLPPYAPDMNPVEYFWAWLKRHAMANYCPNNLSELHITARKLPLAGCKLRCGNVMNYGSFNKTGLSLPFMTTKLRERAECKEALDLEKYGDFPFYVNGWLTPGK